MINKWNRNHGVLLCIYAILLKLILCAGTHTDISLLVSTLWTHAMNLCKYQATVYSIYHLYVVIFLKKITLVGIISKISWVNKTYNMPCGVSI